MSDNDFIILDEEEKKDPKGDGAEKEENHELTASGHGDKEDNDNENEYEKICFICHRPESVTGRMIDLPNNITVCPDCMQRSFDAMTSGAVDLNRLMNLSTCLIWKICSRNSRRSRRKRKSRRSSISLM